MLKTMSPLYGREMEGYGTYRNRINGWFIELKGSSHSRTSRTGQ